MPIGPNQLGRDDPYAAKPSTSTSGLPAVPSGLSAAVSIRSRTAMWQPAPARPTESATSPPQATPKVAWANSTSIVASSGSAGVP